MNKIIRRVKLLIKSIPPTILALQEPAHHPWLLIFDHMLLPSHSRIKRAPFYVRHYFKIFQLPNKNWIIDLEQFKIILKSQQCTPKTLHAILSMYYDVVYADMVKNPNPLIVEEGSYERAGVRLQPNDIIIDAGANLGFFSFYSASKLRNRCQIFGFEAIPEISEIIKNSSIENSFGDSIKVFTSALGASTNPLKFHFSFKNIGGASRTSEGDLMDVPQTTIDNFINEQNVTRLDFIKMDIEGMENEALLGAAESIKKWKPRLAICTYHKAGDRELLTKTIKELRDDYKFHYTSHKLFAY